MFESLITEVVLFSKDLYRNIYGLRESRDLFDDLSDDPKITAYGVAAESASKPPATEPLNERPFSYGIAIAYPFMREHWHNTRFSDGTRFGTWYGSFDIDTTIHETVYHWTRFVRASFADYDGEVRVERRVLKVHCRGLLIDVRKKTKDYPELLDPVSYAFTHQVGNYLYDQSQNGLITKSARCDGTNVALFNSKPLSRPRDNCYLGYRWTPGEATVYVERQPGKVCLELSPAN